MLKCSRGGFALLCIAIGLKHSHHFFKRIRCKLKPSVALSLFYSHASLRLLVFTLNCHWLVQIFPFFWLAVVITLYIIFWFCDTQSEYAARARVSLNKGIVAGLLRPQDLLISSFKPSGTLFWCPEFWNYISKILDNYYYYLLIFYFGGGRGGREHVLTPLLGKRSLTTSSSTFSGRSACYIIDSCSWEMFFKTPE